VYVPARFDDGLTALASVWWVGTWWCRYLTKEKVRDNDGSEQVQYEIAENAYDEVGKEKVLSFIADVGPSPGLHRLAPPPSRPSLTRTRA
jgi:hypothetical protein